MNTNETMVVNQVGPMNQVNKRVGRPRNPNLTKTVYLVDGKLRGKGKPKIGAKVFKVTIPRHDVYDAAKHGGGELVA